MNKNLVWKIALIVVLVVVAVWTLYPPQKTLKPGIDLAGGTSLIYEIDTQGLSEKDKQGLAQRMITVLRRRIDPANIQNLIWRPIGNTRFEIQMPLASAEARQKRINFERALDELLAQNVSRSLVLAVVKKPPEQRKADFEKFAHSDPNKLEILNNLASAYDRLHELRQQRDQLRQQCIEFEQKIKQASLDLEHIKQQINSWLNLSADKLQQAIKQITDANDTQQLLTQYVQTYSKWAQTLNKLADPKDGARIKYQNALRAIDKLNLTIDQLNLVLEMPAKSPRRRKAIEQLKAEFPTRANEIDKVVAAFDEYRPFRGRLDDPRDLQRMLKGAGILEFRLLPTVGNSDLDPDEITRYVEALKEKGPRYASDNRYVWCEIEDPDHWDVRDKQGNPAITAQFGNKTYVLASNKPDETLLHQTKTRQWKLERAEPTTDRLGRRAIGFFLDERGGRKFAKITGNNIGRPLCILLDGIAISAPNIDSRVGREGIITGRFTQTEVQDMVNKLNAGSLPARLIEQPISVNTIGPSIGADNRDKGIRAGFIGLAAVMTCMLIYYLIAGAVADAALVLNILFVLAIMAGVRATFTLPGIAGIILTIGMSVDANVLIFERIREEQQKGSSLRIAIANGYQRAFRAIFDANLTTFITAAILYWVASEEIKGFAIVLMLGIASSMFTALFVTRVFFDLFLSKRVLKDNLLMLRLIHKPNIDWMRSRPVFFTISVLLIAGGLFVFFTRDDAKNNKYDIEFTGGTSVQIKLRPDVKLTRQQVEARIRNIGRQLGNPALAAANVYSVGKSGREFEINTTETNKLIVTITLPQDTQLTAAQITQKIQQAQSQGRFGGTLTKLLVRPVPNTPNQFTIITSQINQSLVKEILTTALPEKTTISEPKIEETVNDAIRKAFADELEIQQNLGPEIVAEEPITHQTIEAQPDLLEFLGGVKLTCKLQRPATVAEIQARLKDLRFKPDTANLQWYTYKLFDTDLNPLDDPNQTVSSFVYISSEPEAALRQLSEQEFARFVENEKTKLLNAMRLETSLPRVRQFDPSIGAEAKTRALIAIILSLFAIVAYIWVRFGNLRYGLAAIIALVHDVCITLGAVAACTYIAATPIGQALLVGDFKINLAMIAAFLTLIGYSLNDTIVVFDRIRENRGKKQPLNPTLITNSINQTISRTLMTSFTTFIVVLIMYIFGGSGLRGFTFAIGLGVIVGTYSSIAIAAPTLLIGQNTTTRKK